MSFKKQGEQEIEIEQQQFKTMLVSILHGSEWKKFRFA